MESCSTSTIESIVTIDSKGQIVLPKSLREKAGFIPDEKIALITFENEGKVSCVLMIKAERLGEAVRKAVSLKIKP